MSFFFIVKFALVSSSRMRDTQSSSLLTLQIYFKCSLTVNVAVLIFSDNNSSMFDKDLFPGLTAKHYYQETLIFLIEATHEDQNYPI